MEEKEVKNQLFRLLSNTTNDLIATQWKGWYLRTSKEAKEAYYFLREFDVVQFHEEVFPYSKSLVITGYEVKGPNAPFAQGIDQALVLLQQGADYAYYVVPRPKRRELDALRKLCENYLRVKVGLILFDEARGTFQTLVKPEENFFPILEEKKRQLMVHLLGRSICGNLSNVPDWCKTRM